MELTTSQFLATLFSALKIFYPEAVDPNMKPPDTSPEDLLDNYTFVIVGAGASGSVLASRLTEKPEWTVLLIEAGGDEDIISKTPLLEIWNHDSIKDWNYTTVEQKKACRSRNGICKYPRGRVMGGSSTINGMMYVRGHKADFDKYEKLGLTGWGYEESLSYFVKSENNTESTLRSSPYHGTNGPLNVQYTRYATSLRDEYIKAGEEMGWEKKDYNGEYKTNVIDYVQYAIDGSIRESASRAYLNPLAHKKNLHVIKNSVAVKIIVDKMKALGVEYYRDGRKYEIFAEKEVILSAGSIDTPKLLMLSGIGPKEELKKRGIDIKADLPVGKGLQDHMIIPVFFYLKNAETITTDIWKTNESVIEYAKFKRGPLSTTGGEAMSFLNPIDKQEPPSVQLMFHSFVQEMENQTESLVRFLAALVRPKSVGSVKLRSSDFRDSPLIDPNYFGEDIDLVTVEKGVRKLFEFVKTPTMKKYRPTVHQDSQPLCKGKRGRKLIRCIVLQYSETVYHPVGTARMGPQGDERTVVTPDFKVRGIERLRVIDASVIPFVPRANTLASAIMVGERGADAIKNHYRF